MLKFNRIIMSRIRNLCDCITGLLILLEVTQCLYGIVQLVELHTLSNFNYAVTGSFYNSGPYACFIAIGFPIALRMIVNCSNKFQKWLGTGMVVLAAILIPASMSRTAILACVIGGGIALCDHIKETSHKLPLRHMLSLCLTLISIVCVCYIVKKDSADGRLLMWRVAAQAAVDAPLSGVGWECVAGTYGEVQERYFMAEHRAEQEILVADAPAYVFNEYLQVAIAYGAVTASVLIALIIGGGVTALRNRAYALAGSVAVIAITMFASYPLQFPIFVITISVTLCGAWLTSRNTVTAYGACAVTTLMCVLFLTHNDTVDIHRDFMAGHNLHKVHDFRKSNAFLLNLIRHTSDPMPLNIIGKNYRALGMPDSAEYYLIRSTHRCPNRLYPHYLLMQLYGDSLSPNPDAQRREAEYILNTREKIPSLAVEEMRQEAEKVLNTL